MGRWAVVTFEAMLLLVGQTDFAAQILNYLLDSQPLLQHNLTVHSFQIIEWNVHEAIQITLPPKLEVISFGMYDKGNG